MTGDRDAARRAAEVEVERLQEEALTRGVRRVFRRELAAAEREAFRAGLVAGIALQRRCQREHDTAEGATG